MLLQVWGEFFCYLWHVVQHPPPPCGRSAQLNPWRGLLDSSWLLNLQPDPLFYSNGGLSWVELKLSVQLQPAWHIFKIFQAFISLHTPLCIFFVFVLLFSSQHQATRTDPTNHKEFSVNNDNSTESERSSVVSLFAFSVRLDESTRGHCGNIVSSKHFWHLNDVFLQKWSCESAARPSLLSTQEGRDSIAVGESEMKLAELC